MPVKKLVLRDDRGTDHETIAGADVVTLDGRTFDVRRIRPGELRIAHQTIWVATQDDKRWVFVDGRAFVFEVQGPNARMRRRATHDENLSAPMPATVVKLHVSPGDQVRTGQLLIVLEAMKMELPVRATSDARVDAVHCSEGQLVQPGQPLIELAPLPETVDGARK